MKFLRFVLVSIGMAINVGCSTTSLVIPVDAIRYEKFDDPPVGTVVTRNIGDRLTSRGVRSSGNALSIRAATTFNKGVGESAILSCGLTVDAGSYFERGRWGGPEGNATCFGPATARWTSSDGQTGLNCTGQTETVYVCQSIQSREYFLGWGRFAVPLKQDPGNFSVTRQVLKNESNRVQELIFNGRTGDSLKFLYREFVDDLIRPAFSQELQYDFARSSEIGFREVRIRIMDATNTSITYAVLTPFSGV